MAFPYSRAAGRVVVGVDGSEASRSALRWAARQAELTGADLEAVMAWKMPAATYGYAVAVPPKVDLPSDAQRSLDQFVQEVLADKPGLNVARYVAEGPAAQTLLREAKGADLLVVGNRGHGALVGLVLGSVSEYCVAHAACPVVVVHAGWTEP